MQNMQMELSENHCSKNDLTIFNVYSSDRRAGESRQGPGFHPQHHTKQTDKPSTLPFVLPAELLTAGLWITWIRIT
jgi:hypothetical protein